MKNANISNNEIKETNEYILEKYGGDEEINDLIISLKMVDNIPLNILAKFWGRIYT